MQQTSPLKTVTVSILATAMLIFVAQYLIGKQEIKIGIAIIPILPMLFAVIIGMIVSAKPVKDRIPGWKQLFTEKEEGFCGKMVGFSLLILGTQYAGMIIPT